MHSTKTIENFRKTELQLNISGSASWHNDYRHSAYIFIGGLNYRMNEADVAIVFSQFGEISDLLLMRDSKTGKSKGFCFLSYEDQRSTILAVDNFNNTTLCGRDIRVDHVKEYKPPAHLCKENTEQKLYLPSGPDGKGWGPYRESSPQELIEKNRRQQLRQEGLIEQGQVGRTAKQKDFQSIIIDQDERWENMLMRETQRDNEQEQYYKDKKDNKSKKSKKDNKSKKSKKSKKAKKENKSKKSKSIKR